MKINIVKSFYRMMLITIGIISIGFQSGTSFAQNGLPGQRQMRTFIPPEHIVSFRGSTPMNQFIEVINPLFEQALGKRVIDPEDRTDSLGIDIFQLYFLDAFEAILESKLLTYRETDAYFIIEPAPVLVGVNNGSGDDKEGPPANARTREIRIDALLFEVNLNKLRETGIDWSAILGESQGGSAGGGQSSGESSGGINLIVNTQPVFNSISDVITGPDAVDLKTLTKLIRFMENEGIGNTVANPNVSVQSGQNGRIQIGSDIPIQTRDFAGNTITEFIGTGIIVDVTPTVITDVVSDSAGAPLIDFIHLKVSVERSSSRPSLQGVIIDRNQAVTQVLLLNGEQTMIGGLFSTQETESRRGIPFLKDLPGWFFGLRYIFGFTQKTMVQSELMIILRAELLEPLSGRSAKPIEEFRLDVQREQLRSRVNRFVESQETPDPDVANNN